MRGKTNMLFLLISLFLGFSRIGSAHSAEGQGTTLSQRNGEVSYERTVSLEGVLQPLLKVAGSNSHSFQNLQNGKRFFSLVFTFNSSVSAGSFYASYSRLRDERISGSPFYIAYHRLII